MYIFYDFETSSTSSLGQIMDYAFVVTDLQFREIDRLAGKVRLNRIQLPDIDAMLVTKIRILSHQAAGESEYEAAIRIFKFLSRFANGPGPCVLVGFNSNAFDLNFLRTMFVRYGMNPYFKGKIKNIDVLHFSKYLAFTYPDMFPWVLSEKGTHYEFRLESLCQRFGLVTDGQTHEAEDDVRLLILLVQDYERRFGNRLSEFQPFQVLRDEFVQLPFELGKQKITDFAEEGGLPRQFRYVYWMKVLGTPKAYFVLDLDLFSDLGDHPVLSCVRYKNPNKHFFVLEPLTAEERQYYLPLAEQAHSHPAIQQFSEAAYFEFIRKDWDIEYQVHELGFQRIDQLHDKVTNFMKNPETYASLLQPMLKQKTDAKDRALLQLFNRVYLNYHPTPSLPYLHRYLIPRYVTGTMLRKDDPFEPLSDRLIRLRTLLSDPSSPPQDRPILEDLICFYESFCRQYHLL